MHLEHPDLHVHLPSHPDLHLGGPRGPLRPELLGLLPLQRRPHLRQVHLHLGDVPRRLAEGRDAAGEELGAEVGGLEVDPLELEGDALVGVRGAEEAVEGGVVAGAAGDGAALDGVGELLGLDGQPDHGDDEEGHEDEDQDNDGRAPGGVGLPPLHRGRRRGLGV